MKIIPGIIMLAVGSYFLWQSAAKNLPPELTPLYLRNAGEGEAEETTRFIARIAGILLTIIGILICLSQILK